MLCCSHDAPKYWMECFVSGRTFLLLRSTLTPPPFLPSKFYRTQGPGVFRSSARLWSLIFVKDFVRSTFISELTPCKLRLIGEILLCISYGHSLLLVFLRCSVLHPLPSPSHIPLRDFPQNVINVVQCFLYLLLWITVCGSSQIGTIFLAPGLEQ